MVLIPPSPTLTRAAAAWFLPNRAISLPLTSPQLLGHPVS